MWEPIAPTLQIPETKNPTFSPKIPRFCPNFPSLNPTLLQNPASALAFERDTFSSYEKNPVLERICKFSPFWNVWFVLRGQPYPSPVTLFLQFFSTNGRPTAYSARLGPNETFNSSHRCRMYKIM